MASSDKYYGFRDQALLAEHIITNLFSVAPPATVEVGPGGLDTPPHSPLPGKESVPPLAEFIAYALYRTRLPTYITHQALLLLTRLKTRYPSARGTSTSPHRLFLSSLMLSSKFSMDDTYSNKSWQVVGQGLFELKEVNQMERELFAFLGWNVVIRDEELAAWVVEFVDPYVAEHSLVAPLVAAVAPLTASSASSSTATSSSASPRRSMEDRKRRRDSSASSQASTSSSSASSSSRSRSPAEDRHRRASDAAMALLPGPIDSPTSSRRGSRGARTPPEKHQRATPYSSRPSSTYSSSSSLSSPISGATTPGSPSTPISAGPLTPDHNDKLAPPSWAQYSFDEASRKMDQDYPPESVQIAQW